VLLIYMRRRMSDRVDQRIVVPAREGRAVRMPAGGRFCVVDLEGQQVGDLFAFSADDITEYASAEHTRVDAPGPRPASLRHGLARSVR